MVARALLNSTTGSAKGLVQASHCAFELTLGLDDYSAGIGCSSLFPNVPLLSPLPSNVRRWSLVAGQRSLLYKRAWASWLLMDAEFECNGDQRLNIHYYLEDGSCASTKGGCRCFPPLGQLPSPRRRRGFLQGRLPTTQTLGSTYCIYHGGPDMTAATGLYSTLALGYHIQSHFSSTNPNSQQGWCEFGAPGRLK